MSSPILADLNDAQRLAVQTVKGPILVVAGAGSGKTRALTHRIAYLIKECGVPPRNILAVTFTNKAAGEMRDRILKLLGKKRGDFDVPVIGTFHSVCAKILRKHIHLMDFENQFAIYDTSDQLVLMKHIFEDLKIDPRQINPRAVLAHISAAKSRLVGPKEFEKQAQSYFEEKVARLYHVYEAGLRKNSALDFDDLLMKTVELFRLHKPILDKYQERFRYIHVDEYQDTNHAQYVLTNLLAAKHRNVCVIGDGDQSIYSWRGADITNILDFEKDYPEAHVIKMEQNYRSSQFILSSAQAVIEKNKRRKEKRLWTAREGGERVKLWIADNERHEGELIAEEIKSIMKGYEFKDYRDFVILYRTNAQSRVLEEVFIRRGFPYKIVGGTRFYERKEIKDLVAYLRVIANPHDTVSLLRIINVPQRQLGAKTLEKLQTLSNIKDCSFFEAMLRCDEISDLPKSKCEQIAKFVKMVRGLQQRNKELPASGVTKFALKETGYKKFLDDGTIEGESRLENVSELISVAAKYDKLEPGISLNIFLEEVSLISDIDTLDEKDNAITLMTLHSAKGLEFPNVFICGLEEGLLPHSQSTLAPERLEEERRLFYVGCTRAMERLYLLYARNRVFYGESRDAIPSQFLTDIPEELLERNAESETQNIWVSASNLMDFKLGGTRGSIEARSGARSSAAARKRNVLGWFGKIGKKKIPAERIFQEFKDGDRVRHAIFGEGTVVSVIGGIITVAFKNSKYGIKRLAITIAPLEKIAN